MSTLLWDWSLSDSLQRLDGFHFCSMVSSVTSVTLWPRAGVSLQKTYKSIKKKTKITFFLHFFIEINVHKIKFIILTIFKYIFLWQLVHWHSCTKINSTINLQNFFLSFPSETVLIKWPLSLPFPQPLATTVTISVSEFDYCLYLMSAESCCMFLFVTDLFHLLYNVFKFNPSWEYVLEFPSFEAE